MSEVGSRDPRLSDKHFEGVDDQAELEQFNEDANAERLDELKFQADRDSAYRNQMLGIALFENVLEPRILKENQQHLAEEEITANTLKEFLSCPVCLKVIKDPMAVRVCLHKICSTCLNEVLRQGRQCP